MKMNTQGTKPEGGGQYIDKPGMYHLVVSTSGLNDAGDYQKLSYECEAVGGEHPDEVGKKVTYDLFLPEGSQFPEDNASNILRFACALGIYSKAQWTADRDGGVEADLPVDQADGLQFVGKVEMKPGKKDPTQSFARITRVYAVGDDEVQSVPMSAEHLAVYGGKLPRSEGGFRQSGAASNGQPAANRSATQPAAVSQQASVAAGDDDDLF